MEIEAKFIALKRIRAKDIERLDISPFMLGERESHKLYDTLLDTGDHAVRRGMHSLRLRYDNGVGYLTLKGPKIVQGATHIRAETEVPLGAGRALEPTTWDSEIAGKVTALIGDAPLQKLMTIHNHRRAWKVYRDGAVVGEVALDRGKITAAGESEKMHEVEIELKGKGTTADLEQLMARFSAALPLEGEPRSKAQRAWALWERTHKVDEALVNAMARVPMRSDASLAEAGRGMLALHIRKLRNALDVAREDAAPEGVHQARVATRHLRAILGELRGVVYDVKKAQVLRSGLRRLARTLGAVRDADVLLMGVDKAAAWHGEGFREGLAPLYALIRERRSAGRAALRVYLKSKKHTRLMNALITFATVEGTGIIEGGDGALSPTRVRDFAGSMLWSRYEAVRAYEPVLASADLPTLHRLRIEVKRLRYTIELFADALDGAQFLRKLCMDVQNHLGKLNDTDGALTMLDKMAQTEASEQYRAVLLKRQRGLYDGTAEALAPLMDAEFREQLARAIAGM